MKRYIFTGKVLPERACVEISQIGFHFGSTSDDFQGDIKINIWCSQISVVLDVQGDIDILTMKNAVEIIVRVLVDTYGYRTGRGYDVEIISVVDPDSNHIVFWVGVPVLEEDSNKRSLPFHETALLALKNPQLQFALFNLREAIRSSIDTGFFCYRAIECIRQEFKEITDKDEKNSWKRLRGNLNYNVEYFNVFLEYAIPQRHWIMLEMTWEKRIELMQKAWEVVDRYVLYLSKKQWSSPISDIGNIT